MRRIKLGEAELVEDGDYPEGFKGAMARFGGDFGAESTGITLYELPPGQALCPYHYELGEEEWALVIEGAPTLRTPEGTERLEPNELVFFPKGPEGAHRVDNETEERVLVLMFSDVVYPTGTVYPDSDKVGLFTRDRSDNVMVERSQSVDYFHGET
jgi:uncharacterized cupin superfamily protein